MEKIKERLVKLGYKLTKPRIKVLFFLNKANKPYSAQEIFKSIKNVDLASVYRILRLLKELELVNEEVYEKEKKYCLAINPHHHIVCRICGVIKRIECKRNYFNKFENFIDIKHQLTITGICNKCR